MRKSIIRVSAALAALPVMFLGLPASAQEKTIGITIPNLASSFWVSAVYGLEAEAKAAGYRVVKLNAGHDTNTTQQIAQIQDLIQRGVSAIVVGPTNGVAVVPIVEQAIDKGIPVIGISSPPSTQRISSLVRADHADMGRLQAECLGEAMGGSGEVGMVAGPTGQAWADLRAAAFRSTMTKKFPNIRIVAESRTAENRNAALTTMEDWLQRFPGMNGIYSATDDLAAGVVTALKAASKGGKVKVSTSNLSPTGQKLLQDGDLVCTSIQQVVNQGRAAMKQAIAAAEKQPTEKIVVYPSVLVTRANMSTLDMSGVTAPKEYRP